MNKSLKFEQTLLQELLKNNTALRNVNKKIVVFKLRSAWELTTKEYKHVNLVFKNQYFTFEKCASAYYVRYLFLSKLTTAEAKQMLIEFAKDACNQCGRWEILNDEFICSDCEKDKQNGVDLLFKKDERGVMNTKKTKLILSKKEKRLFKLVIGQGLTSLAYSEDTNKNEQKKLDKEYFKAKKVIEKINMILGL
jgi:hypothetical protein